MEIPNPKDEDVLGSTQIPQDFELPKLDQDRPVAHPVVTDAELDADFHAHRNLDVDASDLPLSVWLQDDSQD